MVSYHDEPQVDLELRIARADVRPDPAVAIQHRVPDSEQLNAVRFSEGC
jgi:hypothetical protein